MAPVHHGRTATRACRAAVQRTQALFAQLSQDLGLNPNTLSNWRKRATVDDNKTGPTGPRGDGARRQQRAYSSQFPARW